MIPDSGRPVRVRDYALIGAAALLPLWLTAHILWLLTKLAGGLLFPALRPWLRRLLDHRPPDALLILISAALVLLIFWSAGYLIIHVFGRAGLARMDGWASRVPVAGGIYSAIRRLIDVLFSSGGKFQRVVRVEFPVPGQYVVGFVTGGGEPSETGEPGLATVMVPTAPNPTSGFLLFIPEDRLVYLRMPVEEAMALIVSVGTLRPTTLQPAAPPRG